MTRNVFIEGFYKSTKNGNQTFTDQGEALSDDEDDPGVAMIDEIFPKDEKLLSEDDDDQSSTLPIKST